jgi:hypothetical protein
VYVDGMDAETIRMMITAGTAIVAGLGGAGLTALINRRNTKDTLASARAQDHSTWLRNKKQEAYSDFVDVAESIIDDLDNWPEIPRPQRTVSDVRLKRGLIKIVGSPAVRDAAMDVEVGVWLTTKIQRSMANMDAAGWDDMPEILNRAAFVTGYREKVTALVRDHAKLVVAVRQDLGTATPEDDAVDDQISSIVEHLERRTQHLPTNEIP